MIAWSNSRKSWEERGLVLFLLAFAGVVFWLGGRLPASRQFVIWGMFLLTLAVVMRRGWAKLFGPVFFYDLVRTARRSRYFLARFAYALLLVVLLLWLYYIWMLRYPDQGIPQSDLANFAESFFILIASVQFLVVTIVTPAYTAGAISEEKEHKTLEFLLASDLRDREIVFGKLTSRLCNLLLLVLTGLPILSLLQFLGGVDPDLLLASFAITGLTMGGLACLSILLSVYTRRAREAILLTYIVAFLYAALSAVLLLLLELPDVADEILIAGAEPYRIKDLLFHINAGNPFVFLGRLAEELSSGVALAAALPELLREYAVFQGLVIVVCSFWAAARLRVVALRQGQGVIFRRGRGTRRWGRPKIGNYPMLWKEVFEPGFRFSWLGRGITYMVAITIIVPAGAALVDSLFYGGRQFWSDSMNAWVRGIVCATACLTLLSTAVRAAGCVSGERDRQTLDGLLASPLSSESILFSKLFGCILSARWAWVMIGFTWMLGMIGGELHWWVFPVLLAVWLVYAACVAQLGLWYSLTSSTTLRATVRTLLALLAVALGHWLMWSYYIPFIFTMEAQEHLVERLAEAHFGLTPPAVMTWLAVRLDEYPFETHPNFWSMAATAVCGLCAWSIGGTALAYLTHSRFRAMYSRQALRLDYASYPSAGAAATDRPRWRRRLVIAGMIALPILVLVGVYMYASREGDRQLRALIAEIEVDDRNWRFFDIEARRKTYTSENNGAKQAIIVRNMLAGGWPPAAPRPAAVAGVPQHLLDERMAAVPAAQLMDVWLLDEARAALKAVAPAREKARLLEQHSGGRIPVNWTPDIFSTLLPDLQELRTVAVLLVCDAQLRAQEGDVDGALQSTRSIIATERAIGDEQLAISMLVRLGVQSIAVASLERTLALGEPSQEALTKTQMLLEEDASEPLLVHAIRGERAAFHEIMLAARSGKLNMAMMGLAPNAAMQWAMFGTIKSSHIFVLRYMNRMVAAARLPSHEISPVMDSLEAEARQAPMFARMLLPAISRVCGAFLRGQALLRSSIAALAVERYRRQHGRWPDQLSDVVPAQLRELLVDPYDSQPLRYKHWAEGVVVYSVGPDKKDDGGLTDKRKGSQPGVDVGVKLWDVARRRQPPRNPEIGPPRPFEPEQ